MDFETLDGFAQLKAFEVHELINSGQLITDYQSIHAQIVDVGQLLLAISTLVLAGPAGASQAHGSFETAALFGLLAAACLSQIIFEF